MRGVIGDDRDDGFVCLLDDESGSVLLDRGERLYFFKQHFLFFLVFFNQSHSLCLQGDFARKEVFGLFWYFLFLIFFGDCNLVASASLCAGTSTAFCRVAP